MPAPELPSTIFDTSGIKVRTRSDPYSAGQRAYRLGKPFDPEFGLNCDGWGTNSAQCLYERGRLSAAAQPRLQTRSRPLRRAFRGGAV
jgi:hypothetical protein